MLKKIYNISPYFLKFLLLNFKAYINYRKRYKGNFNKYLSEYDYNLSLSKEELEKIQIIKIKQLLNDCFLYSKWYRNKMESLNISQDSIEESPMEVLKKMPFLTKEERKKHVEDIVNVNTKHKVVETGYTSGTSGSPTKNYLDKESIQRSMAIWKRYHKSIGIKPKSKQIRFSGNLILNSKRKNPPFWLYNFFENQLFFSTYHLNYKNMMAYIDKMNDFKPNLLDGYPSAIHEIAKYIIEFNIKLSFSPKAIITTAETLYDYQRNDIEQAFKSKVFNQYASSEGSPFITECYRGKLHLNIDTGYFEFFNSKNEPAKNGEIAKMVVTSFRNNKTPLLRYDIEDCAQLPAENIKCDCGLNMPIVEDIIGREDDLLLTDNKTLIGMMAYKVFKHAKNISKGQIIQVEPFKVIINVEVLKEYSKQDEIFLIEKIRESLGRKIHTEVIVKNKIPLGSNGKFKAVKRLFKLK